MRGDEGYLLALAYSTQRGYGRNHPFAGEIRSGYIDVSIVPEELGFAVNVGELRGSPPLLRWRGGSCVWSARRGTQSCSRSD